MSQDLTTPSYRYKLAEAKRLRRVASAAARALGTFRVRNRLEAYDFAETVGVQHPKVLGQFAHIADVDFEALDSRFALKPIDGSSGRGVFVLERRGERYFDLLRGVTWSPIEVVGRFIDYQLTHKLPSTVIVEEVLPPTPDTNSFTPDKWRLHCFGGTTRLIVRRSRSTDDRRPTWRYRLWYRDWTPVELTDVVVDDSLEPALHGTELVETGDALAAAAGSPYAVFDLFDVPTGVYLNDVTPLPDQLPVRDRALDRLMGEWWEVADAETTTEVEAR